MDGTLETPESRCLGGMFTCKDAHWEADPWPCQAVRQMPGRQQWSDERKTLLFSSLFQCEVPGDGIYVGNHHGEQQWDLRCRDGWGSLAKSPDTIPSIDSTGWLHLCLGQWWQETAECSCWCVEILTSCWFLFMWRSHALPKAMFQQFCNFWAGGSIEVHL